MLQGLTTLAEVCIRMASTLLYEAVLNVLQVLGPNWECLPVQMHLQGIDEPFARAMHECLLQPWML